MHLVKLAQVLNNHDRREQQNERRCDFRDSRAGSDLVSCMRDPFEGHGVAVLGHGVAVLTGGGTLNPPTHRRRIPVQRAAQFCECVAVLIERRVDGAFETLSIRAPL